MTFVNWQDMFLNVITFYDASRLWHFPIQRWAGTNKILCSMAFELDRKPASSGAESGDSANSRISLGAYGRSCNGFHEMNTG